MITKLDEVHMRRPRLSGLIALICTALMAVSAPVFGQPQILSQSDESRYAGEFVVPINKSQILRLDVPFTDLLVGNPEIADVLALTDRSVYVLGKALGATSLTIYGEDRQLIAVADLIVSQDIEGLKARLFEIMPEAEIEVRPANDGIVLGGTMASVGELTQVMAVAELFAPGNVTNLMTVEGSQQVMLSVRFAEVARSLGKELSNNFTAIGQDFRMTTGNANTSPGSVFDLTRLRALSGNAFGAAALDMVTGSLTLELLFDFFEERNLVKTLAEPNLIALSGDTASFLAGGEFPVPVAQEGDDAGTTITVEFKEFGVGLSFTPTVLADGLINIIVSPEVSAIDQAASVTIGGFSIPGLSVRRATTTVELRDGQSFAIAGLLQSNFNDQVRQLPWIGDIPILGSLFRSSNYQRNETELVILVTPHLVKPAPAGSLAAPTDTFLPPSDIDLFLLGRLEARNSGLAALGMAGAGGIDGQFGHIIK